MATLRSFLLVVLVAALVAVEDFVSNPSCVVSGRSSVSEKQPNDLRVVMVADLLLLGSDSGYADSFFRDAFKSKFLRKSLEKFKPDMLLVLGDISANGWKLSGSKWASVLQQFNNMLGPFLDLPLHVILGDRDVGECEKLNERVVSRVTGNLPGLDSAGCSAFEISNISFVSLNTVSMLCGNNHLRFAVERVVERESFDLRVQMKNDLGEHAELSEKAASLNKLHWRENQMECGSGSVLLLHLPLHRSSHDTYRMGKVLEENHWHRNPEISGNLENSEVNRLGPYDLKQTLPQNATEYIFEALRPSIVFSAHSHKFSDHIHPDGTREVTLPAMTWASKEKPGFVYVIFGQNKTVTVSHCSLATEQHVLAYASLFFLVLVNLFVMKWSYSLNVVQL